MKYPLISILLLAIGFTVGYGLSSTSVFDSPDQVVKNEEVGVLPDTQKISYLQQNLTCLELEDSLRSEHEGKSTVFGESSVEQIFYSPSNNSCLYVISYIQEDTATTEFNISRRLFDVRNDSQNSRPLEACLNVQFASNCPDLEESIVSLKEGQ